MRQTRSKMGEEIKGERKNEKGSLRNSQTDNEEENLNCRLKMRAAREKRQPGQAKAWALKGKRGRPRGKDLGGLIGRWIK